MNLIQHRLRVSRPKKWLDFGKPNYPNKFLVFFSTKGYYNISVGFSIASSLNILLTTKPLGCSKWIQYYFLFLSIWTCNLFFSIEIITVYIIQRRNKRHITTTDPKQKIQLRITPSWFEGIILLGNLVNGVYVVFLCTNQHVPNYLSGLVCCMNSYRLIRRVNEFDKNSFILVDSLGFLWKDMILFFFYIFCFACAGYSIFSSSIVYCEAESTLRYPEPNRCQSRTNQVVPYITGYQNLARGLLTGYLMLDRTTWYNILGLAFYESQIHMMYQALHFMLTMFISIFAHFCFKGLTVSLCYICIERRGSIQKSGSNEIDKVQFEWIRTEEYLSSVKLLRKPNRPRYLLARVSARIRESTCWVSVYYTSMIVGFILNIWT